MTQERLDVAGLVGEDIEIPCEADDHRGDPEPAVWIVWVVRCCDERPPYGLACNSCLQRWLTEDAIRTCKGCARSGTAKAWISHFEQINKRPPPG